MHGWVTRGQPTHGVGKEGEGVSEREGEEGRLQDAFNMFSPQLHQGSVQQGRPAERISKQFRGLAGLPCVSHRSDENT